jgi:hypothetical protein
LSIFRLGNIPNSLPLFYLKPCNYHLNSFPLVAIKPIFAAVMADAGVSCDVLWLKGVSHIEQTTVNVDDIHIVCKASLLSEERSVFISPAAAAAAMDSASREPGSPRSPNNLKKKTFRTNIVLSQNKMSQNGDS